MPDFSRYQLARYKDGGRGPSVFDCYGLVRWVGHYHHSWQLLESYGFVLPADKTLITETSQSILPVFEACDIEPEAVAAGYSDGELQHVGIVEYIDNKLQVFQAGRSTGICFQSVEYFARTAGKEIRYLRYVGQRCR